MAIDFSLSEEQELIRKTAQQLVERFEPKRDVFRKKIFVEKEYPQELWDGIAEAGAFGAVIPEEYGGNDMGLLALSIFTEEISGSGFASALMVLTAMDSACIVRNGTEEMKRRILPKVAEGKLKLAFAITEANAGTNTFRIKTNAKKSADGKSYVVNGEKTFITGVDKADMMLLVTRTTSAEQCKAQGMPKTFGLSLFMVDTKSKGISLQPLNTRGIEGFRQFTIRFEDVGVPASNLVGEENGGAMAMFTSLNPERILAGAIACGMSRQLLKRSAEYANQRNLFGDKPIGAYQGVQHPLAHLQMELDATRHLVHRAAWSFDKGESPAEVGYWANAGKYKGAELAIACADRAIQTHGGSGFDEDVGLIHYWDAARLLKTAPINAEMILNFVAEHRLGLPRSY